MIGALMDYGALSAKARALYGRRLRTADFAHMASLRTEAEVWDYLRQQPGWTGAAAGFLPGAGGYIGRIELENALEAQVRREYESLLHFAPRTDRALLSFPVLHAEHRAILSSLRRLRAGGPPGSAAAGRFLFHSRLDQSALAAAENFAGIAAAARGTIYAPALAQLQAGAPGALPEIAPAETLLQSAYFSHMYKLIHKNYAGQTRSVLLRSYGEQVDLLNIIHILRLKTYFPDTRDCLPLLFPFHYRLRPEFIDALCQASGPGGVFELLRASPYAGCFDGVNVSGVEEYYRRSFYLFSRRQLITGTPSVYTAVSYLNLKEAELHAVVTVIESVKYGVPYDDSFARLIGG